MEAVTLRVLWSFPRKSRGASILREWGPHFAEAKMHLKTRYPQAFTWPALVLYLAFFILPSLSGIIYAFTDWSSFSDDVNFVGLKNFRKLFSADEHYFDYFSNTFLFTAVTIVLKTVLGLALALLLDKGVRVWSIFIAR